MHSRLLSFLSDFENAIRADDPAPDDGSWETNRAVNYRNGLARLQLAVNLPDRSVRPRGNVLLQSYNLADGTACLKAHLGWTGTEASAVQAIFTKPGNNWKSAARRLAAQWMAGPPAPAVTVQPAAEEQEPVAAEAAVG